MITDLILYIAVNHSSVKKHLFDQLQQLNKMIIFSCEINF